MKAIILATYFFFFHAKLHFFLDFFVILRKTDYFCS
jgi:hypothetical protein